MAAAGAEKSVEQRVIEVFRTTQETLKKGAHLGGENPYSAILEEQVRGIDPQYLELLVRSGKANLSMKPEAYQWKGFELERTLAALARPLYMDAQNQEIAGLLGDSVFTATPADGRPSGLIRNIADQGFKAADGPVTGTLDHASVGMNEGRLLMLPEGGGKLWNIPILGRDGTQLVDIELVGQQASAPTA